MRSSSIRFSTPASCAYVCRLALLVMRTAALSIYMYCVYVSRAYCASMLMLSKWLLLLNSACIYCGNDRLIGQMKKMIYVPT